MREEKREREREKRWKHDRGNGCGIVPPRYLFLVKTRVTRWGRANHPLPPPFGSSHFSESGIYRSRCAAEMSLYTRRVIAEQVWMGGKKKEKRITTGINSNCFPGKMFEISTIFQSSKHAPFFRSCAVSSLLEICNSMVYMSRIMDHSELNRIKESKMNGDFNPIYFVLLVL